jgi:hypothetical protein
VLIVDEALSVGDVFFQQKCFDRLRRLRDAGVTLLFVTHDTSVVQTFCDQAVLLDAGTVAFRGLPAECVTRYHALRVARPPAVQGGAVHTPADSPRSGPGASGWTTRAGAAPAHNLASIARSRHGSGDLEIAAVFGLNEQGIETLGVQVQRKLHLLVHLIARRAVLQPTVGIHVYDRTGTLVFAAGSEQLGVALPALDPGRSLHLRLSLTCSLYPGRYTISVVAGAPSSEGPNTGVFHDVLEGLGPLAVHADETQAMPFFGIAQLPLAMEVLETVGEAIT